MRIQEFLDTEFAYNVARRQLVGGVPVQFFTAHFPCKADDLRRHLPVQVLPGRGNLCHHTRKVQSVGFHQGKLFHADIPFEENGYKRFHVSGGELGGGKCQGTLRIEPFDFVGHLTYVICPVGDEDDVEGRLIIYKNPFFIVHDQTAHRFDFAQPDTVVFRALPEFLPIDDLQVP